MDAECAICKSLGDRNDLVNVKRGADSLISASVLRKDGLEDTFRKVIESKQLITVHSSCRKEYTRKSSITKYLHNLPTESVKTSDFDAPCLRSSQKPFSFQTHCFYCCDDASKKSESKKGVKYRKIVHDVKTDIKEAVLIQADKRNDLWAKDVKRRIHSIDLFAADAKYHHSCRLAFFDNSGISDRTSGRPHDAIKEGAFEKLCVYLEISDDCQFSLTELEEKMRSFLPENSDAGIYSRIHFKNKLIERYGNALFFTEVPGAPIIVNFKGAAGSIIYEKWYTEKKKSQAEERLRIVQAAAEIILHDIRGIVHQSDKYPSVDAQSMLLGDAIPDSLSHFLKSIIQTKGENDTVVRRKQAAIAEAIIAACRPRSYVSPILLAIGVFVHLTGTRELVDMLSSLSFSASYREVQRYESSILQQSVGNNEIAMNAPNNVQFVFDNADFDVRTLTGHGTFHVLGGLRCVSPAPFRQTGREITRVLNPVRNDDAANGTLKVQWYKKPAKPGLKSILIREVKTVSSETALSVRESSSMNFFWAAGSWSGVICPSSWNGFMRTVVHTGEVRFAGTFTEPVPFINLNASNPSAIYTALLFAVEECKRLNQTKCCVTFDQPLYAKASEMVAASSHELKYIIVRLGGFHLLMSFLGSIGYVMSGSGLEELWSLVYAPKSVTHMISGHAYARALRAHFLTQRALLSTLLVSSKQVDDYRETIKSTFEAMVDGFSGERGFVTSVLDSLYESLITIFQEYSDQSRTSALWIQYLRQVDLVQLFIRAERTGNWDLHLHCVREMLPYFHAAGHFNYAKSAHLYVQQMEDLHLQMPPEQFAQFVQGGSFTIRRKSEFWSGVWTDMAIEQSLMRPMKAKGGLTRGRGISESTLAHFVYAFPGCLPLCNALEELTGVSCISSEQHVELRDSRRQRDNKDADVFKLWLETHSPWDTSYDELRSVSSGIVGDSTFNCDEAKVVGTLAINQIIGSSFGDVKLSRKNRVKPLLAAQGSITVRDETVPVDTVQLLWRILCVMKEPEDLQTYLSHELAPKPPALFDKGFMRQTAKSVLLQKFEHGDPPDNFPTDSCIVVDGGYLLRMHRWPRPAKFGEIVESYVRYVIRHFSSSSTVVFDGYDNELSTKIETQKRRASKKVSANIVFDKNTAVACAQDDFLSNSANKSRLINMLTDVLRNAGIGVRQANGDADTLIVRTALEKDDGGCPVFVVATDTDILVLLVAKAQEGTRINLVNPGTSTTVGKMYCIQDIQKNVGSAKSSILFVHAITGCDTTSALKGKGKSHPWKLMTKNTSLQPLAEVFNSPTSSHDKVAFAGENFIKQIYGCAEEVTINELRVQMYNGYIANQPVTSKFDLSSLPPTSSACRQHSFRAYLQVQEWLENRLKPEEWGWRLSNRTLTPIVMTDPPAPSNLLNLISCGCKTDCSGGRCECRRSGLVCSRLCSGCMGNSCTNVDVQEDDGNED